MPAGFRRVRDKYGEIYDVPEELAMDPDTKKSWILGERQRRGTRPDIRRSVIPEADVMSDVSRSALGFGRSLVNAVNPLPILGTLKEDWEKGRYVGHTALHGMLAAQQRPFEEAAERWGQGDYLGAGAKAAYGAIPLIGPMLSEAGNELERGDIAGGLGSSIGIGLGTFGPKAVGIAKQTRGIPSRTSAISDPAIMNDPSLVPFEPPRGATIAPPISETPIGTFTPRGRAASTIQERFPILSRLAEEPLVDRPQQLFKPRQLTPEELATKQARDMRESFARQQQRQRFGRYEAAAQEALGEPGPSTNAAVFGGLVPERLAEPYTPFPQNQFGLLPEEIRAPSAAPDFGILPERKPTYGLRPSSATEAEMGGIADPNAPATTSTPSASINLSNPSPANIARMVEQGYVLTEKLPDGTVTMKYAPGKSSARLVEPDLADPFDPKSVIEEVKRDKSPDSQRAAQYAADRLAQIETPGFVERQKTKFNNARDFMREFLTESDEAALSRFGEAGQSLRIAAQQATADSFAFSGKQTAALDRAMQGIPKNKQKAYFEQAVDHVERGTDSTNPAIQKVIAAYRANDAKGNALYTTSGMKVKNLKGETVDYAPRENYFPHQYPEGFALADDTPVLEEMVENGMTLKAARTALDESKRAGYGFLDALHQRRGNLPGYRKVPDVAKGHYIDMSRKAYNDKVFGQLGDENSFVRQKINQVREEFGPEASQKVEDIMARYMGKDVYKSRWEPAANMATGFEAFSKLGASILRNIPGGMAMTAARAEVIPYTKALAQSIFSPEARNAAQEMGVLGSLFRDAGKDVGYGSKVGKAYGINWAEKYLRTFSGLAGKNEAQVLFKRAKGNPNPRTLRQLQDLIIEPDMQSVLQQENLTQTQIDRAANRMVDLTQGRADSMNLPHMWSEPNPTVNILTQFKKYAFIQSKNMKDALKANPMMVGRLAPFMALWGEGSADLRSLISGKERPEGLERLIDNMSSAFGLGLASDIFTAFQQGSAGEALARISPPLISDVAKLGVAGFSEEPWENVTEELAGMIPVVGSRARRTLKESRE